MRGGVLVGAAEDVVPRARVLFEGQRLDGRLVEPGRGGRRGGGEGERAARVAAEGEEGGVGGGGDRQRARRAVERDERVRAVAGLAAEEHERADGDLDRVSPHSCQLEVFEAPRGVGRDAGGGRGDVEVVVRERADVDDHKAVGLQPELVGRTGAVVRAVRAGARRDVRAAGVRAEEARVRADVRLVRAVRAVHAHAAALRLPGDAGEHARAADVRAAVGVRLVGGGVALAGGHGGGGGGGRNGVRAAVVAGGGAVVGLVVTRTTLRAGAAVGPGVAGVAQARGQDVHAVVLQCGKIWTVDAGCVADDELGEARPARLARLADGLVARDARARAVRDGAGGESGSSRTTGCARPVAVAKLHKAVPALLAAPVHALVARLAHALRHGRQPSQRRQRPDRAHLAQPQRAVIVVVDGAQLDVGAGCVSLVAGGGCAETRTNCVRRRWWRSCTRSLFGQRSLKWSIAGVQM